MNGVCGQADECQYPAALMSGNHVQPKGASAKTTGMEDFRSGGIDVYGP